MFRVVTPQGANFRQREPQCASLSLFHGGPIPTTQVQGYDLEKDPLWSNVVAQQPSNSGVIIKTRIVKSNGELVSVDYAMRQNDGAWQISDIYLDGTISQLATQRSEFGAILRREGFDGLIGALQRKVKLLAGSVPHAS